MWQKELPWFFTLCHQEFCKGNLIAFEVLMALAFAHCFGFYTPKPLADFLDIPPQKFYAQVKDWSLYDLVDFTPRSGMSVKPKVGASRRVGRRRRAAGQTVLHYFQGV
jgi:hypothetical protein